jgi:adenylosuccinate lyase
MKLDSDTRASAIKTITAYARCGDEDLFGLLGFGITSTDVTDEQKAAVIHAVLPLLSDKGLNDLMHHIAQKLVSKQGAKS